MYSKIQALANIPNYLNFGITIEDLEAFPKNKGAIAYINSTKYVCLEDGGAYTLATVDITEENIKAHEAAIEITLDQIAGIDEYIRNIAADVASSALNAQPPSITLNGINPTTIIQGTTYIDAGATATDITDGTIDVISTGSVDTLTVGTYPITYIATDTAGNTTTATRTVYVYPVIQASELITNNYYTVDIAPWVADNEISASATPDGMRLENVSGGTFENVNIVFDETIVEGSYKFILFVDMGTADSIDINTVSNSTRQTITTSGLHILDVDLVHYDRIRIYIGNSGYATIKFASLDQRTSNTEVGLTLPPDDGVYTGLTTQAMIDDAKIIKTNGGIYTDVYNLLKASADDTMWRAADYRANEVLTNGVIDTSTMTLAETGPFNTSFRYLCHAIYSTTLIYKLDDDLAYGQKAIDFLVAFINPTTGMTGVNPVYAGASWDTPVSYYEQPLGRYLPSLLEACFLLRDTTLWTTEINTMMVNFINNVAVPHIVHGLFGGDINANMPPQGNNHGFPALLLGFQCNLFLGKEAVEYQNMMDMLILMLTHRDGTTSPFKFGMGNVEAGWVAKYGSAITRDCAATFPTEIYRDSADALMYSGHMLSYMHDIARLLYVNGLMDVFYYKNNIGVSFADVIQENFDMRVGGSKQWLIPGNSGMNTNHDMIQIYHDFGIILDKPEYITWAETQRANNSYDYYSGEQGGFINCNPILFPIK